MLVCGAIVLRLFVVRREVILYRLVFILWLMLMGDDGWVAGAGEMVVLRT